MLFKAERNQKMLWLYCTVCWLGELGECPTSVGKVRDGSSEQTVFNILDFLLSVNPPLHCRLIRDFNWKFGPSQFSGCGYFLSCYKGFRLAFASPFFGGNVIHVYRIASSAYNCSCAGRFELFHKLINFVNIRDHMFSSLMCLVVLLVLVKPLYSHRQIRLVRIVHHKI